MRCSVQFILMAAISAAPPLLSNVDNLDVNQQDPFTDEKEAQFDDQDFANEEQALRAYEQIMLEENNRDQFLESVWGTIKGVYTKIKDKITGGSKPSVVIPSPPPGAYKEPGPKTEPVSCSILVKTYRTKKNFLLSFVKPGEFAGDKMRPSLEELPKPKVDVSLGASCFE